MKQSSTISTHKNYDIQTKIINYLDFLTNKRVLLLITMLHNSIGLNTITFNWINSESLFSLLQFILVYTKVLAFILFWFGSKSQYRVVMHGVVTQHRIILSDMRATLLTLFHTSNATSWVVLNLDTSTCPRVSSCQECFSARIVSWVV